MEKLNAILQDAVPSGEDSTGKVAGAAFIVTNKDGTYNVVPGADEPRQKLSVGIFK